MAIPPQGTPVDLRAQRESAGLSRQQLAAAADCSISYLAELEAGQGGRRSKVLKRVLSALDAYGSVNSEAPAITPGPREKSASGVAVRDAA